MRVEAANLNEANRPFRVDPFALPVRFHAPLLRHKGPAAVYLDRDRVMVRRALGGVPSTISCPISLFRGVAVKMVVEEDGETVRTVVELMHSDPAMSVPLSTMEDLGSGEDVAADWQAWGKALGLPLLIVEGDGTVREVAARMGGLAVNPVKARRMVSSLAKRRPRFLKRRKTGVAPVTPTVEGREIIARD